MILYTARMKLRKYRAAKRALLPIYNAIKPLLWRMRNIATLWRPIELKTPAGNARMAASGHIARALWETNFERPEQEIVKKLLKPGMTVVNVGANAGLYTLISAVIVGKSGHVYAFEPASENFHRLQHNVQINHFRNVTLVQKAIGSGVGSVDIHRDPNHPSLDSHFRTREAGADSPLFIERVDLTTLDVYWSSLPGCDRSGVDVLIIDVEGGELEVLLGAEDLLKRSPNAIILMECTKHRAEIGRLTQRHGFHAYRVESDGIWKKSLEIPHGNVLLMRE